jgi:hypothetical protein
MPDQVLWDLAAISCFNDRLTFFMYQFLADIVRTGCTSSAPSASSSPAASRRSGRLYMTCGNDLVKGSAGSGADGFTCGHTFPKLKDVKAMVSKSNLLVVL